MLSGSTSPSILFDKAATNGFGFTDKPLVASELPCRMINGGAPSRKVVAALFATLLFTFGYIHQVHYRSLIPASRLDLLHAIWVHRSVAIDAYHENTSNKAVYRGHYYCDKAPGVSLLSLPAFSIAVGVLALQEIDLDSDTGWLISSWIACAGSLGIITALGGAALFVWLCRWVSSRVAYVTTLAIFLGAAPLPYCTLLMSHGVVVGILAIALWAGDWGSRGTSRPGRFHRNILAGCCCGLALASEYSSGIAVAGILIGFAALDRKRVLAISLGVIPPLMLIPLYHWICFGNPLTFAYLHEASFTQMHEGFFGIKFPPKAESAFMLLLSPERGLFIWSPVLLLIFAGYSRLFSKARSLFWITYVVPVAQVMAISAYFLPSAGGMLGPRLLAPVLIILALPLAFGVERFPWFGYSLAVLSLFVTMVATSVDILIIEGWRNPFVDFHLARMLDGKLSYNLGAVAGLPSHLSLIPLVIILSVSFWLTWRHLERQEPGAAAMVTGTVESPVVFGELL